MVSCGKCNKEITRKRKLRKGCQKVYCNKICAGNINQRKVAICNNCGIEFKYQTKNLVKFCSNKCKFEDWNTEGYGSRGYCNFEKINKILEYLETKFFKGE